MNTETSTIQIQDSKKLALTRYLYLKEEVKLALLIAILKKSESSVFWAYELYYSGYKKELFCYLWKIYYDFYYALNPSFRDYFIKKQNDWENEWKKTQTDDDDYDTIDLPADLECDKIIAMLVNDLLIRPHTADVFMLRNFAYNNESVDKTITISLEKHDYTSITRHIFDASSTELLKHVDEAKLYFGVTTALPWAKMKKCQKIGNVDLSIQILGWIMSLYYVKTTKIKQGKKLYVKMDACDIAMYDTIYMTEDCNFRTYRILPMARLYNIDEYSTLGLFTLERDKLLANDSDALRKLNWYDWLYYASFSPVWNTRISKFHGIVDHTTRKVDFENDDYFEDFYENYGYEPDEQSCEVQNKSAQYIEKRTDWVAFYKEHNEMGLIYPDNHIINTY